MLAYLVIRDGPKWTDVFRLVPGESVRIGRAPTNQIVIKDDRASRDHAEVFYSQGAWTLRDLNSRNGSAVGTNLVEEDYVLNPGDIIRIGRSQLMFVHALSNAFSGAGRVTVGVTPYTAPLWLSLNGGASLVRRSGKAVEASADKSDVGAVVGATAGVNLGGISLYVGADTYLYGPQASNPAASTTPRRARTT